MFTLKSLPFATNALEPFISAKTLEFHHGKHHQAYVDNINKLVVDTDFEGLALETIIRNSANQPDKAAIFNNAAQVYNHDFFWSSLRPAKEPMAIPAALLELIVRDFSSLEKMMEEFKAAAMGQFGSGWAWLVLVDGHLKIMKTTNADTAFLHNAKPLLVLDVWEHAYYLDYQNRRADFVNAVLTNLLNWEFADHNISL